MVLFNAADWVPALFELAGIEEVPTSVLGCSWSYEFEDEANIPPGTTRPAIADLVAHGRDAAGDFLFVIEAKRPGSALEVKDLDPDYYLRSPTFARYSRRYMLYLLDEVTLTERRPPIDHDPHFRGVLTWQQFAGMQIALAKGLEMEEPYRTFIAGAIQYQFCQHGICPDRFAAAYVSTELPYEEMPRGKHEPRAQQTQERREKLWMLDWEGV